MRKNTITYCGNIVKNNDPDRFLISMFAPASARADLWALFAFNHEIAKTREVVSDVTLGHIRLKWWRDEIAKIYEGQAASDNEVISALTAIINSHNLPRNEFDNLIYAREFDLEGVSPENIDGLINYADFTNSPLLRLAIKICGDDVALDISKNIAINYALSGILRAIPFHAGQGRCYLPQDLMDRHDLKRDCIISQKSTSKLSAIVRDVALSRDQFISQIDSKIPKASNVLSEIYFKQIKAQGYNVFSPKMAVCPPFKALSVFWKTKYL